MLYGRDSERAQIAALLDAARSSRSGALVIRGDPGIGKTAVLEDARDLAADMHLLVARGVESESELPFAALHQLLRPALHLLDRLPQPQAVALRGALGLDVGGAQERFLVFAGCLSLLAELAEQRPVVCLVDDAHWLDDASADALRFVSRRLDAEGIVILFGAREGDVRSFDAVDVPSIVLEGLDADAAARLLARRAGVEPIPAVRDELVARTRGNALALLEVPLALSGAQLAGDEPLPEALPLTRQLERVFLERVRRLPEDTQLLLLLAAADDSETMALLNQAATRLGIDLHAFDAAERAGLIAIHGQRLEFRHPLVRSAVYEAATSHDRRAAHRALADALSADDEQADRRAWHLGAAALEPDEGVVRALEEAAARAEARAAYMASTRALERAAELSVDRLARGRLLAGAARSASLAGRDDRAVALAKQALPAVTEPALRAELAHVRELAAVRSGRPGDVVPALVAAGRELATTDPARALQLLVDAADAAWQGGDRAGYLDITRFAATVTPPAADERSTAFSASLAGFAAMITGETEEGVRLLREVAAWGDLADEPRDVVWASYAAQWLGDEGRFASLTERASSLARERGELGVLADTLGMRAGQLALGQQFDGASVAASEAIQLARELKADNLQLYPLAALAIVAAVRGRDDDVRHDGGYVLELANANGLRLRTSMAVYALGLLDLARGRWLEALQRLDTLLGGDTVSLDPFAGYVFPEKIEAAVRGGRREAATAALPQFEAWVGYSGAPAAGPRLAACRALLATGNEATEHFEDALRQAPSARPLDLARIQLLYGEHLRRERQRVDARVQLRTALEAFERFRAEPWAERARAELRATGETARKRDVTTIDQLTPQELQVARYTAEGLTNKEIAARLFLSPRTIDAHLRNVFAKLGVTSRVQLARLPLGDLDEVAAAGAAATA